MPFVKPPNATPLAAPTEAHGQALPSSNPVRMGKLYDAEPVSSFLVPLELLMKPEPVFHGERDNKQREMAPVYEFPMHVRLLTRTHAQRLGAAPILTATMWPRAQVIYDPLTSGLESDTHFHVEENQIIAGRYLVIQYLGSGTFCHTVQCEDLKGEGAHRFVCVKISKNTKDILDQNLWEVSRSPATPTHTSPAGGTSSKVKPHLARHR